MSVLHTPQVCLDTRILLQQSQPDTAAIRFILNDLDFRDKRSAIIAADMPPDQESGHLDVTPTPRRAAAGVVNTCLPQNAEYLSSIVEHHIFLHRNVVAGTPYYVLSQSRMDEFDYPDLLARTCHERNYSTPHRTQRPHGTGRALFGQYPDHSGDDALS